MIAVYDNGQGYSDHPVEFYEVEPLTKDEFKRLVELLGNQGNPIIVDEDGDRPYVIGFVEFVEEERKFGKPNAQGNRWEYHPVRKVKELAETYSWLTPYYGLTEMLEELLGVRPSLASLRELKALLGKIGFNRKWFEDLQ